MGYVDNNLLPGETIVHRAKVHWFVFVPSIIIFIGGILLLIILPKQRFWPILGLLAILFALLSFFKAVITRVSTELAVTSKRVIAKAGLIRRDTVELNHKKVESFNVYQSILGRIFGFGTLVINGTGGGKTPISNVDSPLVFRRKAMQTIDTSQ